MALHPYSRSRITVSCEGSSRPAKAILATILSSLEGPDAADRPHGSHSENSTVKTYLSEALGALSKDALILVKVRPSRSPASGDVAESLTRGAAGCRRGVLCRSHIAHGGV